MAADWYFLEEGEPQGPIPGSALRQYAKSGRIKRATYVRKGNDGKWLTAEKVKGLFDGVSSPAQRENPLNERVSKRTPVGLFLGIGLGVGTLVIGTVLTTLWVSGFFSRSKNEAQAGIRPETREIDPATFKQLYRVAKEIEGAQETGLNRVDFGRLLQKFATELSIAKDTLKTDEERDVLDVYSQALEIWKDSGALWDARISMGQMQLDAQEDYDTFGLGSLDRLRELTQFKSLIILEKLPIQSYPTKAETGVAVLAKHYNLTVKQEDGWRYISADSFKVLWQKAASKIAEAIKMANGN